MKRIAKKSTLLPLSVETIRTLGAPVLATVVAAGAARTVLRGEGNTCGCGFQNTATAYC